MLHAYSAKRGKPETGELQVIARFAAAFCQTLDEPVDKMWCVSKFHMSRKLAVLAEVALALARNRQSPGPLETLKLSI
jgi:hypothetical protein